MLRKKSGPGSGSLEIITNPGRYYTIGFPISVLFRHKCNDRHWKNFRDNVLPSNKPNLPMVSFSLFLVELHRYKKAAFTVRIQMGPRIRIRNLDSESGSGTGSRKAKVAPKERRKEILIF